MVYERCGAAQNIDKVIIAWHSDPSLSVKWTGWPADAENVEGPEEPAARFVKVLTEHPCDGFVRVCADSPFIDQEIVEEAMEAINYEADYHLAGVGRQHGNQAEGFNTQAFLNAEPSMQGDEREHLGLWFQRREANRVAHDKTPYRIYGCGMSGVVTW
jgi:spore coat polysaccharide biosynthesis protein SpsF (cytidylyltransferase family)